MGTGQVCYALCIMKVASLFLTVLVAGTLSGCIERRIEITSEPPGAMVFLNDQQIGTTPTQAVFRYHGVYDVRLEKEGYEPLITSTEAKAPLYENAPLDLIAQALPMRLHNIQRWHYTLVPSLESTLPKDDLQRGLLKRATHMRDVLEASRPPEQNPEQESEPKPEQKPQE